MKKTHILTIKPQMYIIKIPKYKKYAGKNKELDTWVKFIDKPEEIVMSEVEGNEGLKEAQELLKQISLDEHEQELAFKRELYEMDKKAIKAAGYEKGLEEGMQQGKTEGQKEKAIEIAKSMLKENISIEVIIKCTGLTKEEIESEISK